MPEQRYKCYSGIPVSEAGEGFSSAESLQHLDCVAYSLFI